VVTEAAVEPVTGTFNALLCNLLPGGTVKESAGIYVGGLLSVPAKLAEKIVHWEFVEMVELLSDFWTPRPERTPLPRHL
jgi:hypothetical protein